MTRDNNAAQPANKDRGIIGVKGFQDKIRPLMIPSGKFSCQKQCNSKIPLQGNSSADKDLTQIVPLIMYKKVYTVYTTVILRFA